MENLPKVYFVVQGDRVLSPFYFEKELAEYQCEWRNKLVLADAKDGHVLPACKYKVATFICTEIQDAEEK